MKFHAGGENNFRGPRPWNGFPWNITTSRSRPNSLRKWRNGFYLVKVTFTGFYLVKVTFTGFYLVKVTSMDSHWILRCKSDFYFELKSIVTFTGSKSQFFFCGFYSPFCMDFTLSKSHFWLLISVEVTFDFYFIVKVTFECTQSKSHFWLLLCFWLSLIYGFYSRW
jgi:hypothetical protein